MTHYSCRLGLMVFFNYLYSQFLVALIIGLFHPKLTNGPQHLFKKKKKTLQNKTIKLHLFFPLKKKKKLHLFFFHTTDPPKTIVNKHSHQIGTNPTHQKTFTKAPPAAIVNSTSSRDLHFRCRVRRNSTIQISLSLSHSFTFSKTLSFS